CRCTFCIFSLPHATHATICSHNHTPLTALHTLPLQDALPISRQRPLCGREGERRFRARVRRGRARLGRHLPLQPRRRRLARAARDRQSTRLNSSHVKISYAVFCLKKKTWTRSPFGNARLQEAK